MDLTYKMNLTNFNDSWLRPIQPKSEYAPEETHCVAFYSLRRFFERKARWYWILIIDGFNFSIEMGQRTRALECKTVVYLLTGSMVIFIAVLCEKYANFGIVYVESGKFFCENKKCRLKYSESQPLGCDRSDKELEKNTFCEYNTRKALLRSIWSTRLCLFSYTVVDGELSLLWIQYCRMLWSRRKVIMLKLVFIIRRLSLTC